MKFCLGLLSALLLVSLARAVQVSVFPATTCGTPLEVAAPAIPFPSGVTGRIGFYAAAYKGGALIPNSQVALGDPAGVFPMASMFKTLVVHAAMRAVDEGRLKLVQRFTTTNANRSIERYPAGTNSLLALAGRAIHLSDNTASDILHLSVGPKALAQHIKSQSPCTNLLLTTKAWWAAQSGLSAGVLGAETAVGARAYAAQPFAVRLETAARLNAAARQVSAPDVERALESYFHSATYGPELEWQLQNTTTPRAFTDLLVQTLPARNLKPATRQIFRDLMRTGCCIPKGSPLRSNYRAAKAGSGWRILTLSGYVELEDGRVLAYTYLNDQSQSFDAEAMEKQIWPLNTWIEAVLMRVMEQQ